MKITRYNETPTKGTRVNLPKPKAEKSGLDLAIDEVLNEMRGFTADSEEYDSMTKQLERLYAIKKNDRPDRVHPDTIVIVVGNLIGIALIVAYERTNILTSKALAFMLRVR